MDSANGGCRRRNSHAYSQGSAKAGERAPDKEFGQQGQACAGEANTRHEKDASERSGGLCKQQGAGGGGIGHGSSKDATGRHRTLCEAESKQDASGHPILTQEAVIGYSW